MVARHRGVFGLIFISGLFLLGACATGPRLPDADLALTNVRVIDTNDGVVSDPRTILISDRRIVAIVEIDVSVRALRVVDAGDAYAIPGLWDAHVHLLQNDAEAARRIAPRYIGHGVTHVRDMGASLDALRAVRSGPMADAPEIRAAGPAFWAFRLPYGDKSQQEIVEDPAQTQAAVDRAVEAGADFIKVYAGYEPQRLQRLAEAARARGLVLAGHAQPGAAIDAQAAMGLTTVEHLEFQTFRGCGPDPDAYFDRVIAARFRNSGERLPAILVDFVNAVDEEQCIAMLRRAAEAGLVFTPTLTATLLPPAVARERLPLLPAEDVESCRSYLAPFADGDAEAEEAYLAAGRRLLGMVRAAGMPILAGTDAPIFCNSPGAALALELRLLGEAGLTPLEVLQAATLAPARAFGLDARLGTITPGRDADILLLRDNPMTDPSAYTRPTGLFTQGLWRDEQALVALRGGGRD